MAGTGQPGRAGDERSVIRRDRKSRSGCWRLVAALAEAATDTVASEVGQTRSQTARADHDMETSAGRNRRRNYHRRDDRRNRRRRDALPQSQR